MKDEIVTCPICGTKFNLDLEQDDCPYCDWAFMGWENEWDKDEKISANPVTIREAKENLAKGLDIWGDPLPKKK